MADLIGVLGTQLTLSFQIKDSFSNHVPQISQNYWLYLYSYPTALKTKIWTKVCFFRFWIENLKQGFTFSLAKQPA